MPGKNVPFPPMEAELVRELPDGPGWQYEPKWDGFRGVLENDGGELALWTRKGRPLLRYFPELRPLGELLPPQSALDGEIVIARDGALDFARPQRTESLRNGRRIVGHEGAGSGILLGRKLVSHAKRWVGDRRAIVN